MKSLKQLLAITISLLGLITFANASFNPDEWESIEPIYDNNGNVTELLDGNTGEIVGRYEYDPYGNTTKIEGKAAQENKIRFSTKEYDVTSGLYYYGYRHYDPVTGRWPSRDPIEENGGLNLYGMVGNDAVNSWDILGLEEAVVVLDEPITAEDTGDGKYWQQKKGYWEYGGLTSGAGFSYPSRRWIPAGAKTDKTQGALWNLKFRVHNKYYVNPDDDTVRAAGAPVFYGHTSTATAVDAGPLVFETSGDVSDQDNRGAVHNVVPTVFGLPGSNIKYKIITFKADNWTTVSQTYKWKISYGWETAGWNFGVSGTQEDEFTKLAEKLNVPKSAAFCSSDGGVTWKVIQQQ